MANQYRGKYCVVCKKQRNLVWDPKRERCYDCITLPLLGAQVEGRKGYDIPKGD